MPPDNNADADFLLHQITRAKELRAVHRANAALAAKRVQLRQWQSDRLARTYADLLADPDSRPAAEFFLSDLYGLKDTTQRDADIERVYPVMVKMLPSVAIHSIGLALELDALSEELDLALLSVLSGDKSQSTRISEVDYIKAYRGCDNYQERKHQIELIRLVGESLVLIVGKPFVYPMLRTMRKPAQLAGFGELQDFLERGFQAFRHMGDARAFFDTIELRETAILDRIYAAEPNPFTLSARNLSRRKIS